MNERFSMLAAVYSNANDYNVDLTVKLTATSDTGDPIVSKAG
jgi:hypothetical protein